MQKPTRAIISALIFVFFYSCLTNNSTLPEWIIGHWESKSDSTAFYENWEKISDSLYLGEAFVIESNETAFYEKISISKNKESIFYTAVVPDQNNRKQVPFTLISSNHSEIVFENKEHDFPNKIIYQKISPDSVVAKIEGIRNGKPHIEFFPLKRNVR